MTWKKMSEAELREALKPIMPPFDVAVFVAYRHTKHFAGILDTVLP
jgi:hypothetical protein